MSNVVIRGLGRRPGGSGTERAAEPLEYLRSDASYQAFVLLRIGYAVLPIVMGSTSTSTSSLRGRGIWPTGSTTSYRARRNS